MTADVKHRLSAALADRYKIERELGQGGMAGTTVRRYDGTTGAYVALATSAESRVNPRTTGTNRAVQWR